MLPRQAGLFVIGYRWRVITTVALRNAARKDRTNSAYAFCMQIQVSYGACFAAS